MGFLHSISIATLDGTLQEPTLSQDEAENNPVCAGQE
jgi:hypothetical protein